MSNQERFFNEPDLNHLTPDEDAAPQPTGRRSIEESVEPTSFEGVPDHDDGPEVLEQLEAEAKDIRRSIPSVKWANDADHPDYAHLIGAESDGVGPDKVFKLTPQVFELLIEANSFKPESPDGKIVFGLRGGLLANGKKEVENASSVEIEDRRPDHRKFRCTIGYYDRTNKTITAYLASTVPNTHFMTNYYKKQNGLGGSSIGSNMLPTGCYIFRKNAHGRGKINPAMRMSDPDNLKNDAVATVLRTKNDLTYKHDDFWDTSMPYDNIHCAYHTTKFSSAGCQTICGADRSGPWGKFQKELDKHNWNTPFAYLLLTGREAGIAAKILETAPSKMDELINKYLRRLRLGSHGDAVSAMQIKMGYTGQTKYFGPSTRRKLTEFERKKGLNSDSIFSTADDAALGWGAFNAAGAPVRPGGAGTVKPTPPGLDPESLVLVAGPPGSTLEPDGKKLIVPSEGTWSVVEGTGRLTFTPKKGFHGAATPITYQISDSAGGKATAKVSLTVLKVNKAPVVKDDAVRIVEGKPVTISVLANDADTDGTIDPTTVVLVSAPAGSQISADQKQLSVPNKGMWTVDPTSGEVNFAPVAGFTGIVRTTYEVSDDGGKKARGQVTVTVAPETKPPVASDDVVITDQDTPVVIDVLSNDTVGTLVAPPDPVNIAPPVTTPDPAKPDPAVPATGTNDEFVYSGGIQFNEEQLRRFAPKAKEKYIRALADQGPQILTRHGITANAMRFCHFIAQIGHESGGFTIDTESLYYTSPSRLCAVWPSRFPNTSSAAQYCRNEEKLANKVYGGRVRDLGNTEPGDGYKYRGRGLIQTTGRGGYRTLGKKVGVDLEANPDLATDGPIAVKVAAQTWTDRTRSGRSMNQLADANKIEVITLRINGGHTGLAHRRSEFERAWKIWGNGSAPRAITNSDVIERGQRGEAVKTVQRLLVRAGYFPADEKIDGIFGGQTMKKVATFQYNHNKTAAGIDKLNVNGIVDQKTLAALQSAPAVERRARRVHIPRNARDPRQLDKKPEIRIPDRRAPPPQIPDKLPGVLHLVGVLLLISAVAILVVGGFSQVGSLKSLSLPMVLAGLAALSFAWSYIRSTPVGPSDAPPASDIQSSSPWINPTGEYVPPPPKPDDEFIEPEPSAENPNLPHLDVPLQKFGLNESDFEESEPIRNARGLADDADMSDTPPIEVPLPEIVPEDDLEEPGAPDKRNNFGAVRSPSAVAFDVSIHSVPLVLIKMFGGDNNLSHQVANDLNEISAGIRAGRGSAAVIALADTEDAPASVIEVTPAGEQRTIAQLGEIDTGDPDTLATFVSRALATYPDARKAIGFWDHGTGVFDEFDENEILLTRNLKPRKERRARPARRLLIPASQREQLNSNPTTRGMLHDSTGGVLTNVEAGRMLRAAYSRAGQSSPVDLIYSDTCLNGMIEVLEELGEFAQCVIASADTEPGTGWDYESWVGSAGRDFPATPGQWAQSAVRSFSDVYRDAIDQHPCTLAAFHSENQITESFANLVEAAEQTGVEGMQGWFLMAHVRGSTQSYDNRDAFDLIDFAQRLYAVAKNSEPGLAAAAVDVDRACRDALIENAAHGAMVTGAKGLAFWFPTTRRNLEKDLPTYRKLKFAQETGWADYLQRQYGSSL